MAKISELILSICFLVLIVGAILALSGFIFWGIGALIVYVFKINYTWTFLHGVATALIYLIARGTFSIEVKKDEI